MIARQAEKKPDHVVVFSLDYDGTADLLSKTFATLNPGEKNHALIEGMSCIFLSYLANIINAVKDSYPADKNIAVMVYSGSARYDRKLDQIGVEQNKNGSCFETLQELCEENNWKFNPFLYVDSCLHMKPGTGMSNPALLIPPEKYDATKVKMIDAQAENVKCLYPHTPIDFHFIDDDPRCNIISSMNEYFSTRNLSGINLHLHFHWRYSMDFIHRRSFCYDFDITDYCYIKERFFIPALQTRRGPFFPTVKDKDGYDSKMLGFFQKPTQKNVGVSDASLNCRRLTLTRMSPDQP